MAQQRKSSADNAFIAKYIGEQNQSSDEEPEIEVFESPDYDPFVAKFRKINPGLSVEDRGYSNERTDQPQSSSSHAKHYAKNVRL